jgi:hypothetical protein
MSKFCIDCGDPLKGHGGPVRCGRCEGTRRSLTFKHSEATKLKISEARKRGGPTKHFCACGAEVSRRGVRCGSCAKLKGRVGERIAGILLLSPVRRDQWGYAVWSMQCVCGNIFEARAASVRSGNVKSCGCALLKHLADLGTKQTGENSPVWISDRSKMARRLRHGSWPYFSRKVKLERNLTCELTGQRVLSTKELDSHHIVPVAVNPDRCRDKSNISVVLKRLHKEFHHRFGLRLTADDWRVFMAEKTST